MCCHLDNCSSAESPVEAVLFDLDDTLYPQTSWLDGAWERVADAGAAHGLDACRLRAELKFVCAEGSDRGSIIDRALERMEAHDVPIAPLVEAFRSYEATKLLLYPGVREALADLARRVPTALVTDGDQRIQRSKLHALRLHNSFDVVVLSDDFGRSRRKPHPAPLVRAARLLGVPTCACVYIGDRPEKDVAAAWSARMRPIRVRTGEYAGLPDAPRAWRIHRSAVDAVEVLTPLLKAGRRRSSAA